MATTKPKKAAPKVVKTAAKAPAKAAAKTKAKPAPKQVAKAVAKPVKTAAKPASKTVKTAAKTPVKVAAAKKPMKAPAKAPSKAPAAKATVKAAAPKQRTITTKSVAKRAAKAAPVKAAPATTPKSNKAPVKSATSSAPNAANFKPYVAKKGEIYMGKEQLAHFADILNRLKTDLIADIERTVHTMQDEQTVFADPNDRASQETDMALELRNRDRERKLIKKIDETLGRIKADDYGYCDKCGIEIGIQRLEARPTATLCIDCKTLEELREKQVAK